ncbi:signal transduction histidine kinase, glucose-6-phosphate specific [Methylophaga frappieri]|uniref:Signal transduction histidine kinase, glucose-6-phosphate specific n=1 Tax=Methylophaga frappieri (strain ATCC BAA-2434 / DSM 25690 / JAM7) TaxID=754477 RepID=I1YEZ1_METFJ|nr:histidine kinase [Methylophaga frappieri]AFJ01484.1 signal transduction histidine kinase, glucose-6-phosphate specific [Methylophaga frappieri]
MNLQRQLLIRMVFIALLCVFGSGYFVLYQTNQQALFEAKETAKRVEHQFKNQLLEMFQRYDFNRSFPDQALWQQIKSVPGSCIQFLSRTQSRERNLCNAALSEIKFPYWFGKLYQHFFRPVDEVRQPVSFNAIQYGIVLVTLNSQLETTRAWKNLRAVTGVMTVTLLILCLFIFLVFQRLLRPAKQIVNGLEKMREGQLHYQLPDFEINEWKQTSSAINALAKSQLDILRENRRLTLKLMNTQEDERRYIARELHDEFAQCLAGINATTASMRMSVKDSSSSIRAELDSINQITEHMMTALRSLLIRLRPVEVDEIGLRASLQKLIKSWQQRSVDQIEIKLLLSANLEELPDPLPINIYRIIQEALTNIAKHANATQVDIVIDQTLDQQLSMVIKDNGQNVQADIQPGMGLLGINERVDALGGTSKVFCDTDGGFIMHITLPLHQLQETP